MIVRFAFLVALVATCLTGCGTGIPPAGNYATVFGRVTDAASGAGIADATVSINGGVLTATTDSGGNFRITTVPTGPWSYSVQASLYSSLGATNPPDLQPGELRNFPIALAHT
ncbi:MAG: carboxypeptidase regulatory-like domain-containing protein [Candidatus Eremiobacteraeota bacterium]|nr:carboxypeptidase regulatory-like domain-containing protein [Candidatus Eremiobacteraeota bacterium]